MLASCSLHVFQVVMFVAKPVVTVMETLVYVGIHSCMHAQVETDVCTANLYIISMSVVHSHMCVH